MYDPNKIVNPNQVAFAIQGNRPAYNFVRSHNIPDANAMNQMQQICNQVVQNSKINEKESIETKGQIVLFSGLICCCLLFFAIIGASAITSGAGTATSVLCIIPCICCCVGAVMMGN